MRNILKFNDGDRVCFIGDSITHANFFKYHIDEFYTFRFPNEKIKMYNCGSAGDGTANVIKRLDYDILAKKPNKATIMLGMNDIPRDLYCDDGSLLEKERAIVDYQANLEFIISKLQENHIEITLISPTPYDEISENKTLNLKGCNNALEKCKNIMQKLSKKYNCHFIDIYTPLNKHIGENIISEDRVHPNEQGVFLMAYYFLKGQEVFDGNIEEFKSYVDGISLSIKRIILEGFEIEQKLRNIVFVETRLKGENINISNEGEVKAYFENFFEEIKDKDYLPYWKQESQKYYEYKKNELAYISEFEKLMK
jgi:lysophospholipase L1-like esterase